VQTFVMAGYVHLGGGSAARQKAMGEALSEIQPGCAGRESGGPPHRAPDHFSTLTIENSELITENCP
jgi:hypothetical protein